MNIGILSWIAFFIWLGAEWFVAIRTRRLRKHVSATDKDRGSYGLIMIGIVAAIFIGFLFHDQRWGGVTQTAAECGAVMMILGMGFRLWAIYVLGRHFSLSVSVDSSQTLVHHGPYALLRHPAYTGSITTLFGFGLAWNSWSASGILLGMFAAIYGYRIHVEERALVDQFGPVYEDYQSRTWRLFPYIW